ncbi:hypothetical protein AAFN85_05850 [Mucilaginibacter sp. CAU 1740]|uniref:hypothetical protein n=1 Tax=Mucilaginibacter sp. CAU 1740 TaxID=3140365 RepID=UPI00325BE544
MNGIFNYVYIPCKFVAIIVQHFKIAVVQLRVGFPIAPLKGKPGCSMFIFMNYLFLKHSLNWGKTFYN